MTEGPQLFEGVWNGCQRKKMGKGKKGRSRAGENNPKVNEF